MMARLLAVLQHPFPVAWTLSGYDTGALSVSLPRAGEAERVSLSPEEHYRWRKELSLAAGLLDCVGSLTVAIDPWPKATLSTRVHGEWREVSWAWEAYLANPLPQTATPQVLRTAHELDTRFLRLAEPALVRARLLQFDPNDGE